MTPETYTQRNEGCRLACYDDSTGHDLPAGAVPKGTATIGYGCTGPDIVAGMVWTQSQCDERFARDYATARAQAALDLGASYWEDLDPVRQAALADLAYNTGGRGLAAFVKMLAGVRVRAWKFAHDECLSRRPMPTGGALRRAQRNAQMLLTGAWPEPW